jgi:hypothetical protein
MLRFFALSSTTVREIGFSFIELAPCYCLQNFSDACFISNFYDITA